jgi:predicted dehydrogenase
MMRAAKPEVLSFAVPTEARPALLLQALAYRPLAVIAEKPLASSVVHAQQIVSAYRSAGVPLVVNYTRRFMPAWQSMRGTSAMSTTIRYAKGLRHNGTHAIDLCRMLFGELVAGRPLISKHDHWPDDPTVSALLRFERCPEVYLLSMDERCFTLFEVDIIGAASRVIVDRDGTRLRRFELRDGVGAPPGKRLVEIAAEDTDAASAMLNLMRHVQDVVRGAVPLCSGEDALAALEVAEKLAA